MVTDPDRGHSWTKAILGIRAGEIHICMSPAAEQAIIHLIELCGDDYEVERYERKTALICEDEPFVFPDRWTGRISPMPMGFRAPATFVFSLL